MLSLQTIHELNHVENLPDAVKAVALIGWIITGAIRGVEKFAQHLQNKKLPEE